MADQPWKSGTTALTAVTDADLNTYVDLWQYNTITFEFDRPVNLDGFSYKLQNLYSGTASYLSLTFIDHGGGIVKQYTQAAGTFPVGSKAVTETINNVKKIQVHAVTSWNIGLYDFRAYGVFDYPIPTNLNVVSDTRAILVTWDPITSDSTLKGYYVYVNGARITDSPITEHSYSLTGLEPDKNYNISVSALYTSSLNESVRTAEKSAIAYDDWPSKPILSAVERETSLELSWESERAVQYYLFYVNGQLVASTKEKKYTVTNLDLNKVYSFYVQAVDKYGRSAYSDVTSFTTRPPPPPVKPVVKLTSSTYNSLNLQWDNVGLFYDIYVDDEFYTSVPRYTVGIKELQPDTSYRVKVVSHDSYSREVPSNEHTFKTAKIPAPYALKLNLLSKTTSSIYVTWNDIHAKKYAVYINDALIVDTDRLYFGISNLDPETNLRFKIVAVDEFNRSVESNELAVKTNPISVPSPNPGGGPNPYPPGKTNSPELDAAAGDLLEGVNDTKNQGVSVILFVIGGIILVFGVLFLIRIMKRNMVKASSASIGKSDSAGSGSSSSAPGSEPKQVTGSQPNKAAYKPKSKQNFRRKNYHGYRKSYR